jgi:tRNA-Thr(GGU) m(6)t(6)A37 methyltransferase TsaA
MDINIEPIGYVRKDGDTTVLDIKESLAEGLDGVESGSKLDVLYWMHNLNTEHRRTLKVHPRGDKSRPLKGVFSLRSPMRPNPIGVSPVTVLQKDGVRLTVSEIDAMDGSLILDLKASRS